MSSSLAGRGGKGRGWNGVASVRSGAGAGVFMRECSRRPWRCVRLMLRFLELRRSKPEALPGADSLSLTFSNKLDDWFLVLEASDDYFAADGRLVLLLSLSGHGGEGCKRYFWFFSSTAKWWILILLQMCATHMVAWIAVVIFGQYGGPSSTSDVEALLALHWSSMVCGVQVVHPRRPQTGQLQRYIAGGETSRITLSDLGATCTWSSAAMGGGDTL